MLRTTFTKPQHEIIKDVCDLQIQSFLRMTHKELGSEWGIAQIQIDATIAQLMMQFDKLKDNPDKLLELDRVNISLVKHILTNYEERYIHIPEDTRNLWKKLFIYDNVITSLN